MAPGGNERRRRVDAPAPSPLAQRIGRSYEFTEVVEWFAERSDIILLLFDAHKLDISDEFKRAIEALKGQDDKIRVVLNKADMVSNQQLMRVYVSDRRARARAARGDTHTALSAPAATAR